MRPAADDRTAAGPNGHGIVRWRLPIPAGRLTTWLGCLAVASLGVVVLPGLWLPLWALDAATVLAAVLDWLLSPGPGALAVRRSAADRYAVLGPADVTITLENAARVSLAVRLREEPPGSFRVIGTAGAARAPSDREVEWTGAVRALGRTAVSYTVRPTARGAHPWGKLSIRFTSILGLWERALDVPPPASPDGLARVYPNLSVARDYAILARANQLEAIGVRRLRRPGAAWKFDSLRDYVEGDDVRLIDWKATGRRGRPTVRVMEAERNQSILLLVDSGRLMTAESDGVSKLDHAINAALVLADIALRRGDRVGLCTFSGAIHAWVPPRGHTSQLRLLADHLYDLRGDLTESDHGRCLRTVSSRHPKRALLVVLTDFVDAETAAGMVDHLRLAGRRHLVLFAALSDPTLDRAAAEPATTELIGFRKAAAVDLLRERKEVLQRIRMAGALVVDTEPGALTAPLISKYLEIQARALI